MDSFYSGKVVLITGGSSGIGLALARSLAARGARLWLAGRSPERLALAGEAVLQSTGHACSLFPADVSRQEQAARLVEEVTRRDGTPDLLINSAGITHPGYIQEMGPDVFRQMMEVNYFGTLNVTLPLLPGMLARGSGHIVNISSGAGFIGIFGYAAYGASKYAVRGYSDVLRAEMKPHGIRVSVVFPPDTDTPQLAAELPFKPSETKALTGTAKVQSPEAVAACILNGIRRRHYVILPGLDNWFLYHLNNLLGNGVYPLMDLLIARARRKKS